MRQPDGGAARSAEAPSDIPARGWWQIATQVLADISADRVLLVAAGVTFYGLLALFPATAALVSLYGLFADPATVNDQLRLLSGFLPDGALTVIGDEAQRIAARGGGTLGLAFAGTLVLSIWGANAGTKAVFDALNIIYEEPEKRSFVVLTLQSLAFTAASMGLALLAVAGIVVVPIALRLLGLEGPGTLLLGALRWPLLYLLILFALACLYRFGPSRTRPRWRWVTWGSAIAGGVWIVGSLLLSWYVANFGTYNATYGSLGAVIGFMVWLWLSTIIVLVGGEINAEIEQQAGREPTGAPTATGRAPSDTS